MRLPNFKKIFFMNLQIRIILIIFLFLFIPVIILLNYNFSHTEAIVQEKTSRLILGNLEQIGNKIENVTQDIMKISSITGSDNLIISDLSQKKDKSTEYFESKDLYGLTSDDGIKISRIERQINYVKSNFFNYNTHVIIFGVDGLIYSSLDNVNDEFKFKLNYVKEYKNQNWFKALESGRETGVWTAPFSYDIDGSGKEHPFISLSRIIKSNDTQKVLGIITVNFSEDNFRQSLGSNLNGVIYLLNQRKEVIFTSEEKAENQLLYRNIYSEIPDGGKGFFSTEIENKKYMLNYYTIDRADWSLVSVIPYDDFMKEITSLRNKSYTINFLIFGIFIFISVSLILYTINPLKKLIGKIRKMKIGEHSVGLQRSDDIDDVSGIVNSFEYMFNRVEELVKVVIEEQKLETELKYEALRAQINPHFLFNTLNTIKWSAIMSGAHNVSKMISLLGMLLEVSMNKGEDEITFREELELIKSYVFIQNTRYNDKFKLGIEIEEEIYDYKVIKLILQPIVENSIIHGFKDIEGEGLITIKINLSERGIRVEVADNGGGISSEAINKILSGNSKESGQQKFSGIGLKNINERIKLRYGEPFGLEIFSEVGIGTRVLLTLPLIQ